MIVSGKEFKLKMNHKRSIKLAKAINETFKIEVEFLLDGRPGANVSDEEDLFEEEEETEEGEDTGSEIEDTVVDLANTEEIPPTGEEATEINKDAVGETSSPVRRETLLEEIVAAVSNTPAENYDEYEVPADVNDDNYTDAKAMRIQALTNRIGGGARKYRRKNAWGEDEEGQKDAKDDADWAEKFVELMKKKKQLLSEDKPVAAGLACLQCIEHCILRKIPKSRAKKRSANVIRPIKTPALKTSKVAVSPPPTPGETSSELN